jgi:indole-3-glycerol phosphate synthase
MNALQRIVAGTRTEVARRRDAVPIGDLERAAARRCADDPPRAFGDSLRRPGLSVIAEHKRRSPSAGLIREGLAVADVVGAYERGGAAALSILTEGPSFGGSLEDLGSARAAASLPILRKDFVVDRYQVPETRAAGADAILLIVAALARDELVRLHADADAHGLAALVEVHDARELEVAIELGAQLIGINNRNLATLAVDTSTTFMLAPLIPADRVIVAESGFRSRAELEELAGAGVDAVLVGEALMRSPDIEAACRALVGNVQGPPQSRHRSPL